MNVPFISDLARMLHENSPLLSVLVTLGFAVAVGAIGRRVALKLGQSAVLGELIIGVVVGNLGALIHSPLAEHMFNWSETLNAFRTHSFALTPTLTAAFALWIFSNLGVLFLLFQVGLETSFVDLTRVARPATAVAVTGIAVPLLLGYLVGVALLPSSNFVSNLFLGGTLAATSIAVTARVLRDSGVIHTREAKIVLGAAVLDDVLSLLLLAGLSTLATTTSNMTNVLAGAFTFAALVVFLNFILRRWKTVSYHPALFLCLLLSVMAQMLGLSSLVGAYAAGSLLSENRHLRPNFASLEAVFAPVFFLVIGMQVDISDFFSARSITLALALTAVAIIGKLFSGLAVRKRRWMVGFSMVPRGEVGLVFASFGKSVGVLPETVFSSVVFMVIVTTCLTPLVLHRMTERTQ